MTNHIAAHEEFMAVHDSYDKLRTEDPEAYKEWLQKKPLKPAYFKDDAGHRVIVGHFVKYMQDEKGQIVYDENHEPKRVGPHLNGFSRELNPFEFLIDLQGVPHQRLECHVCDEWPLVKFNDDFTECWIEEECKYRDGVPCKFTLNVPSGKMVVANDMRDVFYTNEPYDADDDFNVNSSMGIVQTQLCYAKLGLAHCFVGNTCPSVQKVSDTHYTVANSGYTWGVDGENDKETPCEGEKVAYICTDLWWYSIADHDNFLARGGTIHPHHVDVVDVKPGVYEFEHYATLKSFNRDAPEGCVWTDIKWIGECDATNQ